MRGEDAATRTNASVWTETKRKSAKKLLVSVFPAGFSAAALSPTDTVRDKSNAPSSLVAVSSGSHSSLQRTSFLCLFSHQNSIFVCAIFLFVCPSSVARVSVPFRHVLRLSSWKSVNFPRGDVRCWLRWVWIYLKTRNCERYVFCLVFFFSIYFFSESKLDFPLLF